MSELIYIQGGEYIMGISAENAEKIVAEFFPSNADINPFFFYKEVPEHKIKIDAFGISKYETTNREFKAFLDSGGYQKKELWKELLSISTLNTDLEGWERVSLFTDRTGKPGPVGWSNGSYPEGEAEDPVEGISWFEAKAYCRWKKMRLPSEAEWEYAGRGADGRMFPWGNDKEATEKLFSKESPSAKKVGSAAADHSPFGIMDLAANVSEWVEDAWHAYPDSPIGQLKEVDEAYGIVRGGSYFGPAFRCRVTYRQRETRLTRALGTGFRCCEMRGRL